MLDLKSGMEQKVRELLSIYRLRMEDLIADDELTLYLRLKVCEIMAMLNLADEDLDEWLGELRKALDTNKPTRELFGYIQNAMATWARTGPTREMLFALGGVSCLAFLSLVDEEKTHYEKGDEEDDESSGKDCGLE